MDLTKEELRQLSAAMNPRSWLYEHFIPHWQSHYHSFSDGESMIIQETIVNILHNEDVLSILSFVKQERRKLENLKGDIISKVSTIPDAIENNYYETHADCCPTYWSLFKNLI